ILKMNKLCLIAVILFSISSCATLPKQFQTTDEIIPVGYGPEDMVVDTITEQPRLLISCNSRRKTEPYYGEINVYYPDTKQVKILKRTEPKGLPFYPHGIDLVKVKDSLILLVVNNDMANHENSILRYLVRKDGLVFLNKIVDPLIAAPNAVSGFSDGTLLISNDAPKAGNFTDALFLIKRGKIVYWDGNKCTVAADKFCFANGITIKDKKVYLASTRQNKIWQFDFKDGKMINKEVIAKVNGPDNIRIEGDNLLVACHLRFLAFLKHMKDSTKYSPTTVYRIHPMTRKSEVVYFDDGKQLSAGSTGLAFKNWLYVSGVFDGKMVRKETH
ncbi:MAG: Arylesterase, partial [Bacteroidota bacterium]|nr:Arylesterase [Bacteroidota bacterium]